MAKINPSQLAAAQGVRETKTFNVGTAKKPEELTLTFEAVPGYDLTFAVLEKADEYALSYLTGSKGASPAPLPPIAGRSVKMSRRLCNTVALLEMLEVPDEGEEKYDFFAWCQWAVLRPGVFDEIAAWAFDLKEQAEGSSGPNGQGADAG